MLQIYKNTILTHGFARLETANVSVSYFHIQRKVHCVTLKRGHQAKMKAGLKMQKMMKYSHVQALCGCSINIYATEVFLSFQFVVLRALPWWFIVYQ